MNPERLSLAEIETHDPRTPTGRETRYLCPLPACAGHQNARQHRSLSVNSDTGVWRCHRCKASGLIVERWTARDASPSVSRRDRERQKLRQKFALPPEPVAVPDAPLTGWRARLGKLAPLEGSPGAEYLAGRGLPVDLCHEAGVRFAPEFCRDEAKRWQGWPAVVFPVRDMAGSLVAAQGRAITGPAKITFGPKQRGVFATPGALEASLLVVTEAPIDALSLACCGLPAVATIGTDGYPDALVKRHAFGRGVIVGAQDADEAGNNAAGALCASTRAFGAVFWRLSPPDDFKDWNAVLCAWGREKLTEWLLSQVADMEAARAAFSDDLCRELKAVAEDA